MVRGRKGGRCRKEVSNQSSQVKEKVKWYVQYANSLRNHDSEHLYGRGRRLGGGGGEGILCHIPESKKRK